MIFIFTMLWKFGFLRSENVMRQIWGCIPVLYQNFKPLKNRARCLKIFRLACFMLTYSKALATFCSSFILQSLIFIRGFSNTFVVDCVVFSSAVMTFYVLQAGDIENWLSMFLEKPTWFFFSNLTLVFWKRWH